MVLGVSKDSIPTHDKFAEKYELPYVLLSDPDAEVMKKYGAFGKKMMYGKEVQGTIRSTVVIGPKGDVIKHWPAVKKAVQHPVEVWEFLKSSSSEQRPRYLREILRSPSTLLRQGYGGFSSPSSSQQAARYSAKENKWPSGRRASRTLPLSKTLLNKGSPPIGLTDGVIPATGS